VENVDEPQRGGMIAEKILLAFQPPMRVAGATLRIGTSIGIAAFPNDARDPVTLLKQADTAMYRAKQQGRNTYCYYAAHWNVQHAERRSLEQALRLAVERGEMSLHYQPRVDVASGRVNGMEALLRWQHPELGEVAPRRFLPLAEKNGLIMPIGYWGLRLACQQAREWQDQGAKLKVAVNFTRRQLGDPGLEDNIAAILADTGMQAEQLEIELTEATLMDDSEQTTAVLHRLRALGVGVTIDGFGSGPSSLRRLSELPIGTVKIGRSFVQGLPDDDAGAAITSSIIDLAHRLHCSVVAQGAETQQQYDFLRAQGCDGVQGFYFSAAMPAEYFSELVHAQYH
jgi:EAL domain-containing protein (putative c-di-GMP-specific phosphodiesterase class I)